MLPHVHGIISVCNRVFYYDPVKCSKRSECLKRNASAANKTNIKTFM